MAENKKGKIEKFDRKNFHWWLMEMEDNLHRRDLYLSLTGEKPEKITN